MEKVDVAQHLVDRNLNYLLTLKLPVPLINQLGHGGCIYTRIMKCIWDTRALEKVNVVYSKIGFNKLCKMTNTYTIMLFSLHSHNFISADICYDMFKEAFGLRIKAF